MSNSSPSNTAVLPTQDHSTRLEQSPLLFHPAIIPSEEVSNHIHGEPSEEDQREVEKTPTPLPLKQLFVLCVLRLTEPVSFTVIFPFINQMIEELHIVPDETQVGTYAGLIESLFALSQLCTVLFWGRLSDRIGRKPVLLTGLTGLSIGIIAFGLQRRFIGLVIARSFAGAMNGNIAVVKSALAELTDETNKARAFPVLPLCYALGLTIGPAIGGYSAEPAKQYPNSIFARWSLFTIYPYFLPCFLSGLLNLLALGLGACFLNETLPSKTSAALKQRNDPQAGVEEIAGDEFLEEGDRECAPPMRDLLIKPIMIRLISYGFLSFENSAWLALVPLFSYTRIEDGGLGLSLKQIGTTLSSNGVVALLVQVVVFPVLQRKMGTVQLYRLVKLSVPISFMSLPLVRFLTKRAFDHSGAYTLIAMCGMITAIAIKSLGNMGVVCVTLLINDSAPNHASLGTINGLAQSFASLARSIAPFVVGKLFSMTLTKGPDRFLTSNFVWLFLFFVSIVGYLTTWMIEIQNPKAPSRNWKPLKANENSRRTQIQPNSYGTI